MRLTDRKFEPKRANKRTKRVTKAKGQREKIFYLKKKKREMANKRLRRELNYL